MRKKKLFISLIGALFLFLLLLLFNNHFINRTEGHYYVSNDGSDSNTGRSPRQSWKTLKKVNKYKFKPGDVIYFKRGDVWRGQLIPNAGAENNYIEYTAYGTGEKPVILGSFSKNNSNDWKEVSDNIWSANATEIDVGNIIFNNGEAVGIKVWSSTELDKLNEFYYDSNSQKVELFCIGNPALTYSSIECAINKDIISQANKSYIVYDSLSLKYGAAHGIGGRNTSNIIVRNCDISYIGGGDHNNQKIRFGNGIEFWANAQNNTVENCKIWEIYDAGLTNQNNIPNCTQQNITYKNNEIWNCEYSFEYWNRPVGSVTKNIVFTNNKCSNAGGGWGHSQRPNPSGRQLCLAANTSTVENLVIENNTFYGAEEALIYLHKNFNQSDNIFIRNNIFFQYKDRDFARWKQKVYSFDDYTKFIIDNSMDKYSPLYVFYGTS